MHLSLTYSVLLRCQCFTENYATVVQPHELENIISVSRTLMEYCIPKLCPLDVLASNRGGA
jgi:hypothetical protein